MNAKAKGRRQEYRTMRLLEAAGYRTTRAAASLGAFDIIGISATDVVLVQVKPLPFGGGDGNLTLVSRPLERAQTCSCLARPQTAPRRARDSLTAGVSR